MDAGRPSADANPDEEYIRGLGWNATLMGGGFTAAELDVIVPDRPVFLQGMYAAIMGGADDARLEDKIGSLEFGKWVDLVVLESDLFSVLPSEIADVIIVATMKGGSFTI